MQCKKDYSYGVIPVIKTGDIWEVFILKQISYRGANDQYWTFPKGHSKEAESHQEAALRELDEESGIMLEKLETDITFNQEYSFIYNQQCIEKQVIYYLGYAADKSFVLQPEEVAQGQWCSFVEAREKLTHAIAKELLDDVSIYLKSKI